MVLAESVELCVCVGVDDTEGVWVSDAVPEHEGDSVVEPV